MLKLNMCWFFLFSRVVSSIKRIDLSFSVSEWARIVIGDMFVQFTDSFVVVVVQIIMKTRLLKRENVLIGLLHGWQKKVFVSMNYVRRCAFSLHISDKQSARERKDFFANVIPTTTTSERRRWWFIIIREERAISNADGKNSNGLARESLSSPSSIRASLSVCRWAK